MRTARMRSWLADSSRLVHLSVLVVLPLVIFLVIEAGELSRISYFVFPPLASATFTIFFDPEGVYSTPQRMVGGLTLGAAVGWLAFSALGYSPAGAAAAVLATSVVTWPLDLEHPSAYSTALLGVVLQADSLLYVAAVFVSTAGVALVFVLWRDRIYEERARFLYDAVRDEDRVLVPAGDEEVVRAAARIAGAHDDGRVVLLGFGGERADHAGLEEEIAAEGIRTEVAVAAEDADRAAAVREAAERHGCTLLVLPYGFRGREELLAGDLDAVALRLEGAAEPRSAFVPVKGSGKLSRLMVEMASRLVDAGDVSVATIIHGERARRAAEKRLFNLVSAFEETAASRSDVLDTRILDAGDRDTGSVIAETAGQYDITVLGASTDRSRLSRLIDAPTAAEVVDDIDGPVAVVHAAGARRIASALRPERF